MKSPITIEPKSRHHASLYDADREYLATTPIEYAELVRAAFEAEISRIANTAKEKEKT